MPQKLCDHCHLPLTDPRSNQKRHKECAKIAHLIQCKARSKNRRLILSPVIEKVCPVCEKPYKTRENRNAATCKNPNCKNVWQRKRMKAIRSTMTREQIKAINKKKYDKYRDLYIRRSICSSVKKESETLDCICPGCGIVHKHTFEPKWIGNGTPRIKCDRYPNCVNGPAFKDGSRSGEQRYASTYGSSWECSNSATL